MPWLILILVLPFLMDQTATDVSPPSSISPTCVHLTPSTYRCEGDETIYYGSPTGGASTGVTNAPTATSGPAKKYTPYDKISVAPDGAPCISTGYVEEGQSVPRPSVGLPDTEQTPGAVSSLFDTAPRCPIQPSPPGSIAPLETPAMIARRYWEERVLPVPKPSIAPGRAITGKLAYLETKGTLTNTYQNNTAFGPLSVVASGSYMVSWGDGTTTGPFNFEGQAWPVGRITHDYLDVGTYNIVVTEQWTATWSLGGQSGVLRTLQTTGTINNFPVQQIQAVIGR